MSFLFFLFNLLCQITAFSNIAGACDNPQTCMTHNTGLSISLSAPSTQFQRGVPIKITMTNNQNQNMAGFLLYAVGNTSLREGSWTVGPNMQIITCGNDPSEATATICHSSNTAWGTSITFTFTPSATSNTGTLVFQGVGVQHIQAWNALKTLTLTRGPDPVPVPGSVPTPTPTPPIAPPTSSDLWDMESLGYTYSVDVGHGMTFYWKPLIAFSSRVFMAIRGPTSGYVAVGFTDGSWRMLQSDVVLGYPGFSSVYYPVSQDLNGFGMQFNDKLTSIQNTSAQTADGYTTLLFSRLLADGYNPASAKGYFTIVAACSQDTSILKHNYRSNWAYIISIEDGTLVGTVTANWNRRVAHGVIAGVAFTLVLPMGALVARAKTHIGKHWFNTHQSLQFFGFLLANAAIIIGYTTPVIQFPPGIWHAPLGTVIFILIWLQVLGAGIKRPHPPEKGEKASVPRLIFEWFHRCTAFVIFCLAIAQIVEGILVLEVPYWAYAIWAPFAGIMIIFWVLIKIWNIVAGDKD